MQTKCYGTVPKKKDKTDVMLKDEYLKEYILETVILSRRNLKKMLKKYSMVVFKPNIGGGGRNVGFVFARSKKFKVILGLKNYEFFSFKQLHNFIVNVNTKKQFILQKGVDLLKCNKNPFDIRVEVQKLEDDWQVTGIVAKVAEAKKLVTNRHSGGKGTPLKQVFNTAEISYRNQLEIKNELGALGRKTAVCLNKKYEHLKEIGLDVGIDKNLNLYVLEVNTKPQFGIFKQLEDKTMYNEILKNNKKILSGIECYKRYF